MTPLERQGERIASIWPTPRRSRFTRLEYAAALTPYHPDAVATAVNTVRDTWLKDIVPPPGEFTVKAQAAQNSYRREHPDTPTGDGVGCPKCRAEHGEHAITTGHHPRWTGDGTIICCATHNTMWLGTTHQPDEQDPGDLDPGEWRRRALTGAFGETLRRSARPRELVEPHNELHEPESIRHAIQRVTLTAATTERHPATTEGPTPA